MRPIRPWRIEFGWLSSTFRSDRSDERFRAFWISLSLHSASTCSLSSPPNANGTINVRFVNPIGASRCARRDKATVKYPSASEGFKKLQRKSKRPSLRSHWSERWASFGKWTLNGGTLKDTKISQRRALLINPLSAGCRGVRRWGVLSMALKTRLMAALHQTHRPNQRCWC